jgi:hypothetical protein
MSSHVLGEALELSPFTKQLYSSDAFGIAESYYLGALLFRRALRRARKPIGSKPSPRKAGSRSCAFTARSMRGSTGIGGRTRSKR